jgi:hypothetical protein
MKHQRAVIETYVKLLPRSPFFHELIFMQKPRFGSDHPITADESALVASNGKGELLNGKGELRSRLSSS